MTTTICGTNTIFLLLQCKNKAFSSVSKTQIDIDAIWTVRIGLRETIPFKNYLEHDKAGSWSS